MKSTLFFTLCLFFVTIIQAQDLITTRKGEDIKAKVLEIGVNEIKYKLFDNPNGPLYVVTKQEILIIRYENGNKEIFEDQKPNIDNNTRLETITNWDLQGKMDAKQYYRGYKGSMAGTFWTTTLLSPIVGLIPAIATSSKAPQTKKYLMYPNDEYFKNLEYKTSYMKEAHRMKSKKVWGMWGIGILSFAGVSSIIAASIQ